MTVSSIEDVVSDGIETGASCSMDPDSGYSDIGAGTQITVSDGGTTLAVGTLEDGITADDAATECEFAFTVDDVPKGHKFYGITIGGNDRRGKMNYSYDQLQGGSLVLTLGDE